MDEWDAAASTFAEPTDALIAELSWSVGLATLALVGLLALALWHSKRRTRRRMPVLPLAVTALGLTLVALSPMIVNAVQPLRSARGSAPRHAMTVLVRAYRWRWELEPPNGMVDGQLRVPVGRPVRLLITSEPNGPLPEDAAVIHGLSIPAMRVRADAVPGRVTEVWFTPTRIGEYPMLCSALCGTGHSRMLATVRVVEEESWDDYVSVSPTPDLPPAEWGEEMFAANGCPACHAVAPDQPDGVGPNLHGVAGSWRALQTGQLVVADEHYLRTAITDPERQIVQGEATARMPAFNLSEREVAALVAYVRTLRD